MLLLAAASGSAGCASWHGARLYLEGSRALERGDAELAVRRLEAASERVPRASEVQNHLGLAYAAAGHPEEAERAFRRAVELDCDNRAARANLIEAGAAHPGGAPAP